MVFALTGCGREDTAASVPTVTPPVQQVTVAPLSRPTERPTDRETTLLFTGDLIPVRCSYAAMRAIGDYDAAFDALRETLVAADITAGTLDTSLAPSARPYGCIETFNLAGPVEFAGAMARAGYDVVAHATNHAADCGAVDCGRAALLETIVNVRANGVQTAGSGANLAAARTPAIVERNGVRFGFLAYDDIAPWYHADAETPGIAPLASALFAEDIAAAKLVADFVIVMPNWGVEYTDTPTPYQREVALAMALAGADLVVGNHPHWVQAYERIGETFVAYALGNFVFDQDWSLETQQGAMLEVTLTGTRITGTRFIPIRIADQHQPRLAAPDEAAAILQRIEAASAGLR